MRPAGAFRARLFAVLVAAGLVAGACVQDEDVEVRQPKPEAKSGGTLTVGILAPRTVAPWLTSAYDPYGHLVVTTMCDPVIQLDTVTAQMRPALASKWRMQSASALVITLRKELRFSDGRDIDGDDVVESVSRPANSEFASPVADLLEPVGGSEFLREVRRATERPNARKRLAGISSPEPKAVTVGLSSDQPDFFTVLGHPLASVVPSDDFEDRPSELERNPVCVGPYRLAEPWDPAAPVVRLVRSEQYYGANAGYTKGGRGYADVIEFHVFPDLEAAYQAYLGGAVDVTYLAQERVVEARSTMADDVVHAPTPTMEYIGLPVNRAPFDRAEVRTALSLALDRRAIAERAYSGVRAPATRFLPTTLGPAYAEGDATKVACRATTKSTADVDGAREQLERAGIGLEAVKTTLSFNDDFENRQLAELVAEQWRTVLGLEVELNPLNWERYLDEATGPSGFQGAFRMSWSPQSPDPNQYLSPLFSTEELGKNNWSRFSSGSFDRDLAEVLDEVNEEDRRPGYTAAESALCVNMPMIPVVQGGAAYLMRSSRVGSAASSATDRATGQPVLRELFVKGS